ncbi:MAG: hypothetical protein WD294_14935 [Phycisphaeraceae bacterium]
MNDLQRQLARHLLHQCRRRPRIEASATELLERITTTIGQLPVDDRGAALDTLKHHLAAAATELSATSPTASEHTDKG